MYLLILLYQWDVYNIILKHSDNKQVKEKFIAIIALLDHYKKELYVPA